MKKLLIAGLACAMLFGVCGFAVSGVKTLTLASEKASKIAGLEVEAVPASTDVGATGEKHSVSFVNPDFSNVTFEQSISLFTEGNRAYVSAGTVKTNVAVLFDANTFAVKKVYNKAPSKGAKPAFNESTDITPANGEAVLLACDSSYASAGYKKYLAENFAEGDVIKFRLDGQLVSIKDVLGKIDELSEQITFKLDYKNMFTVFNGKAVVSGKIDNCKSGSDYSVCVVKYNAKGEVVDNTAENPVKIDVDKNGAFSQEITVGNGTNYLDVYYTENSKKAEDSVTSMVVYDRSAVTRTDKEVVLWADQFSNAKVLNTAENADKVISNVKKAGITAIALDVKGPEGYVSYKKATLTNCPYLTNTINPDKKLSVDIDILEETIKACRKHGVKIYAAFNFFTEGNVAANDSAVLADHPDWEEILQAPEDKGEFKTPSKSARSCILKYVNPANDEVVDFQLKRAKEVLENYDVDGIVMDRTRYDNFYADFSSVTMEKFAAYLSARGKTYSGVSDAFLIDENGNKINGKYYKEWIAFRSSLIKDFASKLKELIDEHNKQTGGNVLLSAYVGSAYDSIYQTGINWAASDFSYNQRLNFPENEIYGDEYNQTSYLDQLDFLMVGTYFASGDEVAKYSTLANILTDCKIPVYASLDITSCKTAESQRSVLQSAVKNTDGCMIFDMICANYPMLECAIRDVEYVKPYDIGFYADSFGKYVSVSDRNAGRNSGDIILYDDKFGKTTGTNVYGVEIVVGADGRVTAVKNKKQAQSWSWGSFDKNDSEIVEGGFVISGADASGDRAIRQTLAKAEIGEKLYAAYLTDYLKYNIEKFGSNEIEFSIAAAVYGSADSVEVKFNGKTATKGKAVLGDVDGLYEYTLPVELAYANNAIVVTVEADGKVVLKREITVVCTDPKLSRITTEQSYYRVKVGEAFNLNAKLVPAESKAEITYKSSDTGVIEVSADGTVTAIGGGRATVTVNAGDKQTLVTVIVETENSGETETSGGCNGKLGGYSSLALCFAAVGIACVIIRRKNASGK